MANSVTFPSAIGGDNSTVTDDDNATTGLANGGAIVRLVPMFSQMVAVCSWTVNYINTSLSTLSTSLSTIATSLSAAQNSALNAATSATQAANQANTLTATSSTSTLISTGSKTFTTQSGEQFIAGQFVTIASSANPTNYMYGQVTSYVGSSLTINVSVIGGSGTFADWLISLSGLQGNTGETGAVSISMLTYANRATLRTTIPTNGSLYSVESLGIFRYYNAVIEPDDDETSFVTASGTWLVENPHWDLIDANQTIIDFEKDDHIEDVETRATILETFKTRFLVGTAVSSITSISSVSQQSFTGAVVGAVVGDSIIVNPPNALTAHISLFARVTAPDTITIYLNNPSAATATLVAGTFNLTVIKAS